MYNYGLSITSQFYFCAVPFRLDSYMGCAFSCNYCFMLGRSSPHRIIPTDVAKVHRYFAKSDNTNENNEIISECIRHRLPIHFGGISDPFQPAEIQFRISLQLLRLLREYDYPTIITTKSDLIANKRYLDILKSMKNLSVQVTITTLDKQRAKYLEPFAPSPHRRLRTLEVLSNAGIHTACRVQPIIPGINDKDVAMLSIIAGTGCSHIIVEHFKLPADLPRKYRHRLSEILGDDIISTMKRKGAIWRGMDLELKASAKLDTVLSWATAAHDNRMSFGAADNDLRPFGDSPCCCGVDRISGFNSWYKQQNSVAISRALEYDVDVKYFNVANEWTPNGNINRYINSKCRGRSTEGYLNTMQEHYLRMWNSPSSIHSPTEVFGVKATYSVDKDGCHIYSVKNLQEKIKK